MSSLFEAIQQEVQEGRVKAVRHSRLPLTLYGYKDETVYGKLWNETNRLCRALVLDDDGQVVNHPFPKFFNYEELTAEEKEQFAPHQIQSVQSKEDGSLIVVFYYIKGWIVTSRGSWDSEQANAAAKLLLSRYPAFFTCADKAATYLFELVGPSNVNVCRYLSDELILLAIRTADGDYPQHDFMRHAHQLNFKTPRIYSAWNDDIYRVLKADQNPNIEGVVLTNRAGHRCKVKTDLYCQLHRLLTNMTDTAVFEMWRDKTLAPIEGIPDEFYAEIKQKIAAIETEWQTYLRQVHADCAQVKAYIEQGMTRKDIAINHPDLCYIMSAAFGTTSPESVAYKHFCKR